MLAAAAAALMAMGGALGDSACELQQSVRQRLVFSKCSAVLCLLAISGTLLAGNFRHSRLGLTVCVLSYW
jgi:hypothetical protein